MTISKIILGIFIYLLIGLIFWGYWLSKVWKDKSIKGSEKGKVFGVLIIGGLTMKEFVLKWPKYLYWRMRP